MKSNFTLIMVLLLLVVGANATDINVPSGGSITDAIDGAADGDVIILDDGGVYDVGEYTLAKSISIIAPDGVSVKPVITIVGFRFDGLVNARFTFKNVEFAGNNSDYFLRYNGTSTIDYMEFDNADVHGFPRCAIRANGQAGSTLDTLIIINSKWYDFIDKGYRMMWIHTDCELKYFKAENSTFDSFNESVLWTGSENAKRIIVNNCTINEKVGADRNGVFQIEGSEGSSFLFSNNIVTNIETDTSVFVVSVNVADTILNCRYNSIAATAVPLNEWNRNSDYSEADPQYADATNDDYTVGNESFKTASTQGGVIGDMRWFDTQTGLDDNTIGMDGVVVLKDRIICSNEMNSLSIYSLTGNLVKSEYGCTEVSITDLNSGIYILKAIDKKGVETVVKLMR